MLQHWRARFLIHGPILKRGKKKWNSRYMALIRPVPGASKHLNPVGSMYYFKNAKRFMAQASSGGATSVDVARLFAPPPPGKEVPKELTLAGYRVEPRADKWHTPSGSFGFLVVDDKGAEYLVAVKSRTQRDLWVSALDSTIHAAEARAEVEEDKEVAREHKAVDAVFGGGLGGASAQQPCGSAQPGGGASGVVTAS